ncbi:MAG: hypothetical protein JO333_15730 [Verrucomicrobia bacterium]|nr:hypothetical protein [Verrucomicrobiota bacterium]
MERLIQVSGTAEMLEKAGTLRDLVSLPQGFTRSRSVESSELKARGLFMPALNLARSFVLKTLAKRGEHAAS